MQVQELIQLLQECSSTAQVKVHTIDDLNQTILSIYESDTVVNIDVGP